MVRDPPLHIKQCQDGNASKKHLSSGMRHAYRMFLIYIHYSQGDISIYGLTDSCEDTNIYVSHMWGHVNLPSNMNGVLVGTGKSTFQYEWCPCGDR